MNFNSFDALIITNPTNIRYLTGFVGAAPEEREAYCLITQKSICLFTNALYLEQSKNFKQQSVQVVEISRENPLAKELAKLTETLHIKQLGFEETDLTVAEYGKLRKELPSITLVPTQNRIEELRMIKRDDEIENIRAAAKITDLCFSFILGKLKSSLPAKASVKEGVTESEIAWEIESFIKTHGASLAFSPIVAFGPNTSQPHYQVQPQGPALRLRGPNIILLDFGAQVNGYCSDMTRVVFIGKPEAKWVKAYDTVLQAQTAALEYLASRPGLEATGGKADRVARDVIEKSGFPPYPHSLGHGVGLDIHESPRLTISKDAELKPGMIVTVEPGIYIEGQYGIRIEDLILLKEDGIEILSTSNKQMIIL
ncbi:MAG: Xaa-Pro peptidase family protein [Patescibacteria group bacterium]